MSFKNTLRRCIAAALCIFLVVGTLSGCSDSGDTFVAAVADVPDTLDPQLADSEAERIVAVNLFEGLFRLNGDGTASPAICSSYVVSDDGLTWTFTLRDDAFYNTEEDAEPVPVTAEDFVFAVRRLFSADSPYRATFTGLDGAAAVAAGAEPVTALGIHAADAHTLIIRLSTPDNGLPIKLCSPGAMPCPQAFYEATQGTYGLQPETILTNGAFRLSLWSSENGVTLRRINETEGMVNRIRLVPAAADTAPADRFAAGETTGEFITGLPADGQGAFCVQTRALLFNCNDPQLAQPGVRAGLAGVLYRAMPAWEEEGVSTAGGLVPESITLGGQSWRGIAGSLLNEALPTDAAATYRLGLETAGRSKLDGITVLVPDTPAWRNMYSAVSQAWQQQLSAFFSVQYLPQQEIDAAVAAGNYQLAFVTRSALQDDVAAELNWYMAQTGYTDEAVSAQLTAAVTAGSAADTAVALRSAELQLLGAWPAVPMVSCSGYYALADNCTGVAASPFGPLLDFAGARWLTEEQ